MKKINVNQEACIGCGACVAIDPDHFEFNDEGLSHPLNQENLDSSELHNAMDSCPTSAISFIDGDSQEEETEDKEECCDHCDGHCCCENEEEA